MDWTHVYCQLAALQLADPIFHASNFARIPTHLLWDILEHCSKRERTKTNADSMATAKLGTVVVSAVSTNSARVKVSDFLPYEMEAGDSSVSSETKEAMRWALRTKVLPRQIVAMLGAELS